MEINSQIPEKLSDPSMMKDIARTIRGRLVQMSHDSGAPHLGSSLSCVDILVAAYWGVMNLDPDNHMDPKRDRLLLSKGHAAPALYACLAYRGFFSPKELQDYSTYGSRLAQHPAPNSVPGVEAATGSLGHGLSMGVGIAIAANILGQNFKTYVVLSDGECNEGSVWEAAMLAPNHGLGRLVAIIDYNKWQATGRSNEVMKLESLKDKWKAFGWNAYEVDGHNIEALLDVLTRPTPVDDKPTAVIAHTVKGKGIPFMEDDNNWHYRIPDQDEVSQVFKLLGLS